MAQTRSTNWTHRAERAIYYLSYALIITVLLFVAAVVAATNNGIILW